ILLKSKDPKYDELIPTPSQAQLITNWFIQKSTFQEASSTLGSRCTQKEETSSGDSSSKLSLKYTMLPAPETSDQIFFSCKTIQDKIARHKSTSRSSNRHLPPVENQYPHQTRLTYCNQHQLRSTGSGDLETTSTMKKYMNQL
ncbi:hypothetical protein CYY_002234, partial [Polysphondylium violaceum]